MASRMASGCIKAFVVNGQTFSTRAGLASKAKTRVTFGSNLVQDASISPYTP
jgi:hypothetical protein